VFFITFAPFNHRQKNVHFVLIFGTFRFADYTYSVTTTYEYEYDAQGSATVVKEYEDGKLTTTRKRIIEYY